MSIQTKVFPRRSTVWPDISVLAILGVLLFGVFSMGSRWSSAYHAVTEIDLSLKMLPYYTLLSATRGLVAFVLSFLFTIIVGYTAAKSRRAEKFIIPLLDLFQSIPPLGFLPGILLTLVALFPQTNTGIELTAIIMIFTGQVWNLTFCFYAALKSIPTPLIEATRVMHLSRWARLKRLELPFSSMDLSWNALMSMAGGWFFLIPCEAFVLGAHEFRLPGIGAYMHEAIRHHDVSAMGFSVVAMVGLIVGLDWMIWRPLLSWVKKFRLESKDSDGFDPEPLMQVWLRESTVAEGVASFLGRTLRFLVLWITYPFVYLLKRGSQLRVFQVWGYPAPWFVSTLKRLLIGVVVAWMAFKCLQLLKVLSQLSLSLWWELIQDAAATLVRVFLTLVITTAWTLPMGIWIGLSPKRVRLFQPWIQILASFPASMLNPLLVGVFFKWGWSFEWSALLLMAFGVQWYVLFNVLAGALKIPRQLEDTLNLMQASTLTKWKRLYIPSVFPSLVTGWISAAGGAWNTSMVVEYLSYEGGIVSTRGLGSTLNTATANQDFVLLTGSLTVMIVIVIFLNRFFWTRLYELVQTRFRMDGET